MLRSCCGSSRWVDVMVSRRPFASDDALFTAARQVWFSLQPSDWHEAFAHHPRIGDREDLRARFPETHHLSQSEQAGVATAATGTLDALAAANDAYERRFGHTFIVCATGRTAAEILALLNTRLRNSPDAEVRIAAEEQARITELRLRRLT